MLWRWGPSDVGHSCLGSHKLHLLSGASCVSLLLQHGAPSFFSTFCGSSLLASPFLVSIIVEMSDDLVDKDIFLFVGFLRGRVIFSVRLCYNVCRGDGDLRIGAFVPRSHMLHLLTQRASCVCGFYLHGVPALAIALSFLSSYRPACSTRVGGAISFCHDAVS